MRKTNKTSKQEKIRKNCQKEYEKYHSVKHASSTLRCDERTVEKYYKEFEQQEPVETNLGFIQTQRSVKNRVLPRMDWILDKLEKQFDRISKQQKKDGTVDMARYETLKTRILKLMSDVLQQKASIEITPTLDISLENYIKEKQQRRSTKTKEDHIDVYFNLNHPDRTRSVEEDVEDIDVDDDIIDSEEKAEVDPEKLVFHQKHKKIENKKNWVPVTGLFRSTLSEALNYINKDDENSKRAIDRISALLQVRDSYAYPIQIIPKTKNYMEVTEIFIRVNSSGSRLRSSDLALAQITSRWQGSLKNEFSPFRKACADVNFEVVEGDMIKFLIAISLGKNKFELINKISTQKLKENWPKTQKAIEYSLNFLKDAHIETKEFLTAKFLLIPIGCFLQKVNYVLTEKMRKNLLRWFYAATMWGRYSRGATETALDEDLNAIYKNDDSIEQMINNVLKFSGRLDVAESDLQGVTVKSPFFVMSYVYAKTNHAKDWETGLEVSVKSFGKAFKNEYDHIFPQAKLKPFLEKKFDKSKAKSMVNDIGNICFLQKVPNIRKSDTLPEEHLPKVIKDWGEEALSAQNITLEPSLWSLDMYEEFLKDRHKQMATGINNLMNSLG